MVKGISDRDRLTIVSWAKTYPEIKRVYLYGSRARGDNRSNSDVDLGIEVFKYDGDENSQLAFSDWKKRYESKRDLALEMSVHIEWYERGQNLEYVGPGIERDGIVLFERE